MATTKFLDLAGLQLVVDNIKTLVGNSVSKAELKGAEFDNTTGKISLNKGEGSVEVSLSAVDTLTGAQLGLLKASDYAAMQNVIEGVAIQVGDTAKSVTIQDKTALIEYLSAIPASNDNNNFNNLYKAPNAQAVVDYVGAQFTEKMAGQATEEYVNSTVTSAIEALTKAFGDADGALSEALTKAINDGDAAVTKAFGDADAALKQELTDAYTNADGKLKEDLQKEIDDDISAFKATLKKEDVAVAGKYVSAVSEVDGVITVSRESLPVYSLKKTDDAGYKYELTVDGVKTGDAIDIKDMVVSGGSVSTRDGKTYLDLTIANGETVSIPADSLVDTYTAGDDRIIVGDYAISLNLANLTRDLVADDTMKGTFATVSSVQKVADDLSELDGKVTEHLTTANNTYATKDEALTSLSELSTTGSLDGTAYSASFNALDVSGNTQSTVTFDLVLASDIADMFK